MIEVLVVGEGPTEATFVREVLSPEFAHRQIFLHSRLIATSRMAKGGGLTPHRVLRYLRNTLKERDEVYVSTFFDLYGLARDFPGQNQAKSLSDPIKRAKAIEDALHEAVVAAAGCRPDRFLPHIQPYEFESLLFSDVSRFADVRPKWKTYVTRLQAIRYSALTPEHINDGWNTHPSARLTDLLQQPRYDKRVDGSAVTGRIGLPRIRAECRHFSEWLDRIENLPPLRSAGTPR